MWLREEDVFVDMDFFWVYESLSRGFELKNRNIRIIGLNLYIKNVKLSLRRIVASYRAE